MVVVVAFEHLEMAEEVHPFQEGEVVPCLVMVEEVVDPPCLVMVEEVVVPCLVMVEEVVDLPCLVVEEVVAIKNLKK
jgi:hypothetical protein